MSMNVVDPQPWARLQSFVENARNSLEIVEDAFDAALDGEPHQNHEHAEALRKASIRLDASARNVAAEVRSFIERELLR